MDNTEIIIDKTTYKIMKYLYRKPGVKLGEIRKKFGDDEVHLVSMLCHANYVVLRKTNGSLTQDTSFLSDDFCAYLLVPGNKYVEDRRTSNAIRITPIFVSVVSVIVSIIGLIISISSSNTELFVHILK